MTTQTITNLLLAHLRSGKGCRHTYKLFSILHMYVCTHYVNIRNMYVRTPMEFIFEFEGLLKRKNSYIKVC